jgi:crotonobetainyl-CoA:carnitine CoA-transferase CaiB-like acyl-CoA transferase
VPAAPVADPRATHLNPQLAARGFYERVEHPLLGALVLPGLPFRYASVPRWLRSPAPTLGQHGREILGELADCSPEEIEELAAAGVIGERPEGV